MTFFYERMIPVADGLYDPHLQENEGENDMARSFKKPRNAMSRPARNRIDQRVRETLLEIESKHYCGCGKGTVRSISVPD